MSEEGRFWKWLYRIWFILLIATVSVNVATFRQQARNRPLLIEIQQRQEENDKWGEEADRLKAEISELKKEADRLKKELEGRK